MYAFTGYAYVQYIDNNKDKQAQENVAKKWLPYNQINNVPKGYRAKAINWYSPPDKERKKEKDFSVIQENEYSNRGHVEQ